MEGTAFAVRERKACISSLVREVGPLTIGAVEKQAFH